MLLPESNYGDDIVTSFFDEVDLEVAPILLELRRPVVFKRKTTPLTWGTRRKRSLRPLAVNKVVVAAAGSPVTPLSFSPSESDDKCSNNNLNKKVAVKRKREEWLKIIENLSIQNELLKVEVENKNQCYLQQKALNVALKTLKFEVEKGLAMNMQLALAPINPPHVDRRLTTADQTVPAAAEEPANPKGQTVSFYADCGGLGNSGIRDNSGPRGFDLNVPAPETDTDVAVPQPSDQMEVDNNGNNNTEQILLYRTKVMAAAEARQKRKEICRAKMSGGAKRLLLYHSYR